MENKITQFNRRINYLITETDAVYHNIALRLGLRNRLLVHKHFLLF